MAVDIALDYFLKFRGCTMANKWNESSLFLIALVVPSIIFLCNMHAYFMPSLYVALKFSQDAIIATVIYNFGKLSFTT